ncbi:MAG: hypothetical protein IPJ41_05980 [Phycisphaerales bacterium]|nr:hypothetical protein [Phycisphaerales bacterium]
MFLVAIGIGVIPIPWAYATLRLSRFLYRRMTIGLTPGDYRFNDAWHSAFGWTFPGYHLVLPVVLLTLAAVLAHAERRRGQRRRGAITLCLIALSLGAVSWIVGLVGLAATIWNV